MIFTSSYCHSAQTSLSQPVSLEGIGVHSAEPTEVTIYPAKANTGYVFKRIDEEGCNAIKAHIDNVTQTDLCTVLGQYGTKHAIATVEHLLAALYGMGIDNAYIEVNGGEVPILDGSSSPFVEAFKDAGITSLSTPRRFIEILKPIHFEGKDNWASLKPAKSFTIDITINFDHPFIGEDRIACDIGANEFEKKLSFARTFGFVEQVEALRAKGFCKGSSYENSIALTKETIRTKGGLRCPREFVRHKALDAVGDLAMAGLPLLGHFSSFKGGHGINANILRRLFEDKSAWRFHTVDIPHEKTHPSMNFIAASAVA